MVLAAGVVAVLVAFERWTAGDVMRVAVPCVAVAAAVWPYGVFAIDNDRQAAFFALAVVTGFVAPALPRHRVLVAVVTGAYVAVVGVAGVVLTAAQASADLLVQQVVVPTGITAVLLGIMFPNKGFYDVMSELEVAREREAELAVARERIRFAGDLHDIQGHTLHVVKMKVALASKVLASDVPRAARELEEVGALVSDTIAQIRELAYGRRALNLSAELENARTLLEASGARVHVTGAIVPDFPSAELTAQVLRETTTNILRHSRAQTVQVLISRHGVEVVNDGVPAAASVRLRGLETLSDRVTAAGGELTARLEGGHFRTAVSFGPTAPAPAPAHMARSAGDRGPARSAESEARR